MRNVMLSLLRQYLEAIADIFKRVDFGGFMGLAIPVSGMILAYFSRADLANIPGVRLDTFWAIIGYISLVFVAVLIIVLAFQFIAVIATFASQQIPLCIDIECPNYLDEEREFNQQGNYMEVKDYAFLKIKNKENSEITNCYAILKQLRGVTSNLDKHAPNILGPGSKRLCWKDSEAGDTCAINIGRSDDKILHIYQTAVRLDSTTFLFSNFCLCDRKIVINLSSRTVYQIELEIHGTVNGKEYVKKWNGYVDVENSQTDTSFKISIGKGNRFK